MVRAGQSQVLAVRGIERNTSSNIRSCIKSRHTHSGSAMPATADASKRFSGTTSAPSSTWRSKKHQSGCRASHQLPVPARRWCGEFAPIAGPGDRHAGFPSPIAIAYAGHLRGRVESQSGHRGGGPRRRERASASGLAEADRGPAPHRCVARSVARCAGRRYEPDGSGTAVISLTTSLLPWSDIAGSPRAAPKK